jgi:hypothetical protein
MGGLYMVNGEGVVYVSDGNVRMVWGWAVYVCNGNVCMAWGMGVVYV